MEILLDNCIASVLFMDHGVRREYGIPQMYVSAACEAIIRGYSKWDHDLLCCPTLMAEFRAGMDPTPIDKRMKYIALCDKDTEVNSSKEYVDIHYKNVEDISSVMDRIEKYLKVDFKSMNADQMAKSISENFKISRYSAHMQILNAGREGSSKIDVPVIDYSGNRDLAGSKSISEVVNGYSKSRRARILVYYILSAIFVPVKGDTVFPFIKKGRRDRRKSFTNDFLYLYFIVDRKCIFFSSDSGLLFRSSSALSMFGIGSIVVAMDINHEVKTIAEAIMRFDQLQSGMKNLPLLE